MVSLYVCRLAAVLWGLLEMRRGQRLVWGFYGGFASWQLPALFGGLFEVREFGVQGMGCGMVCMYVW